MDDQIFRQIQRGDWLLFAYPGRMGLQQVLAEEVAQETCVWAKL